MDISALKVKIEKELVNTKEKIATLKDLTKPISPDVAIGRISRMDAINNKSVNEAALRQTELKYQRLKLALDKVDQEGFGKCSRCGGEIQEGRLMLMPENTFCIRCAR